MEEKIVELIAKLEGLAPHVWGLAVRQVWVQAMRELAVGLALLPVGIVVGILDFRRGRREEERALGDPFVWYFFALVVGLVPVVVGGCLLYGAVGKLLNPQWYALKLLIDLLPVGR